MLKTKGKWAKKNNKIEKNIHSCFHQVYMNLFQQLDKTYAKPAGKHKRQ